jgi:FdhD protein
MEEINPAWTHYGGIKTTSVNSNCSVNDGIVIEKGLQLIINETPFTLTMRMPGHEDELAVGLLYAEDIVTNFEEFRSNYLQSADEVDSIQLNIPKHQLKEGYLNSRNFLSLSSCGVCGKTELPTISSSALVNHTNQSFNFEPLFKKMKDAQTVFSMTGGCHAAAIFDNKGNLLVAREDIGRHNAVDKCIGHLILTNQLNAANILIVSGRVSYEIVIKCFRAKISTLASVSAPSSLAIDYCKELGIQLFSFCRGTNFTQYS